MHYPNQNQVNPKHRSKVIVISFRWAFSGFFCDPRYSQKGLIFIKGQKMLVQIMYFTIKNMHEKLRYYFSFYHPQRREKCQIAFKYPVVIFLFMLIHYLHNTA